MSFLLLSWSAGRYITGFLSRLSAGGDGLGVQAVGLCRRDPASEGPAELPEGGGGDPASGRGMAAGLPAAAGYAGRAEDGGVLTS